MVDQDTVTATIGSAILDIDPARRLAAFRAARAAGATDEQIRTASYQFLGGACNPGAVIFVDKMLKLLDAEERAGGASAEQPTTNPSRSSR